MALGTYTELRSALADWMVGQSVTGQLDGFIALAEAELNRKLRTREMLSRSVATLTTQYAALPADFLEAKNFTATVNGSGVTLRQVTMFEADWRRETLEGGTPEYVVVSGTEIEIVPAPAATGTLVEIVYYAKLPALSSTTSTNWLLTRWPDAYLNVCLAHAQPYLANPEMGAFHRAEADRIIEEIRFADSYAQLGASPLIARPRKSF